MAFETVFAHFFVISDPTNPLEVWNKYDNWKDNVACSDLLAVTDLPWLRDQSRRQQCRCVGLTKHDSLTKMSCILNSSWAGCSSGNKNIFICNTSVADRKVFSVVLKSMYRTSGCGPAWCFKDRLSLPRIEWMNYSYSVRVKCESLIFFLSFFFC